MKIIIIFCFLIFFAHGENSLNKAVKAVADHSADTVSDRETNQNPAILPDDQTASESKVNLIDNQTANEKKVILGNQQANFSSKAGIQLEQSAKDYLIERLDYLNRTLPEGHRARKPLNLRLAHILSLQAEENFMKAEKEKCKSCKKIAQSSARRSLSIYKTIDPLLKTRHPLLHTESLFKRAYLFRFLGEKSKSLNELKKIVAKNRIDPSLEARAWFSIGEIYFELYDYKKSLKAFNRVLKQAQSPWRFKSVYRKIWSLSNLSLYEQSVDKLESFLKSDLYSNPDLDLEERKLKQKLEDELIVLYNYAKITDERLAFLYSFSKQNQNKNTVSEKNKRLLNLAKALNRIGRMNDSNKVWQMYMSKTPFLKSQLQAYFFMVDNDLALSKNNLLEDTGQKLEKIFSLQEKVKIAQDFKQALRAQTKRFFNQINPKVSLFSENQKRYLLTLYQKYSFTYLKDIDILSRSAFLARDLSKYALSQDLFQEVVLHIDSYENKKISKAEIKENMSFWQMEMAELTKDEKRRLKSYDFYIQHGSREDLAFKAGYQKAYISYENKKYKESSELFKKLALYKVKKENFKKLQGLRLKAAHLSLSALDQLGHQEEELARRAGLFIKVFPQDHKEFIRIYHSALLNTVKKLVSHKDFSRRPIQASLDKNILKAWEKLQLISLKEATKEEALTYHFNRLLLAKELLKFEAMDQSFQALLADNNLEEEDKKNVLTWKLWLVELRFDFKEVLRLIKILQPEDQSEGHLLRLARLAELSGKNPIPYYKIFIEKFPNSQSTVAVLTSIIEKSSDKNKKIFLQKYASFFKRWPDTLTYLILKVDKGRLEEHFINPFFSLDFMKASPLASFSRKKEVIESFEKELANIVSYSLPKISSGDRLTRAIKNYSNKIDELDTKAKEALKAKDWTARVFIISHWKRELSRFYNSIMELPLPKSLTAEEEKQYIKLLQEQLQPYKEQIVQMQNELNSLWSRDFLKDYMRDLKQGSIFYGPLKWEMEKLFMVSDGKNKNKIQLLLSSIKTQEQMKIQGLKLADKKENQTQHLYQELRKNPFDKKSLVKLLELEETKKNKTLSYYLVNRIKELKKKNSLVKLWNINL